MTVLATYTQNPGAKESYSIDYSDDLEEGDFISTLTPPVVTVSDPALIADATVCVDTIVKMWFQGGVVGTKYLITVTSTTNDGRILVDEFYIKVKD
jgi:hypothetical protein